MIIKGNVVEVTAGKECGRLFLVTQSDERYALIADGRKRKLLSPKNKNLKHLRFTGDFIEINDITDKKLRNVLRLLSTP